jgi:hypothetical protein
MDKRKQYKLKIQVLVFIGLFILLEIILRLFGMRAGTLIDKFVIEENPQYMPRLYSDEMGINHIYANTETLIEGTVINKQGFRGKFEYIRSTVDSIRKYTGRKIVMIIGDSYVEGCCADTVKNSFPDLVANGPHYEVLNFGVAGTDPLQYSLITRKYVKELMPDMVVVAFYFGNDFQAFGRKPSPGSPITFPFKKNLWIYSNPSNYLTKKLNYGFKRPDEAYNFYIEHYTLRGKNRNWFQKIVSYSVIISKIYLGTEHEIKKREWSKMNLEFSDDNDQMTHNIVKSIKTCCDSLSMPFLFIGIPAPTEAKETSTLMTKYKKYFREIPYYVPTNLTKNDYDGTSAGNHFNNIGHKKYADFLLKLLNEKNN